MQKDDQVYLQHMMSYAKEALDIAGAMTRPEYDADRIARLALAHLLETIGEAASRVSPEFRQLHPEIPWSEIVAMRHRIVHGYDELDFNIVWTVLEEEVGPLVDTLATLLDQA